MKSAALGLMLEKMGPDGALRFATYLLLDIIYEWKEKCPRLCVGTCKDIIEVLNDTVSKIEEEQAEQIKECHETGECVSHREAAERLRNAGVEERNKEDGSRAFLVNSEGKVEEVPMETVRRLNANGVPGVVIESDGIIDRDSLPEGIPEKVKDLICEKLPEIKNVINQFSKCKTDAERENLLALLQGGGGDPSKN